MNTPRPQLAPKTSCGRGDFCIGKNMKDTILLPEWSRPFPTEMVKIAAKE
jgi:hypothetical protein